MPRDTLSIPFGVIDQLTRLGVAVPPHDDELTTEAYIAFWREVAAVAYGKTASSEAALHAPTLGRAFRSWERTTPLRWRAARS